MAINLILLALTFSNSISAQRRVNYGANFKEHFYNLNIKTCKDSLQKEIQKKYSTKFKKLEREIKYTDNGKDFIRYDHVLNPLYAVQKDSSNSECDSIHFYIGRNHILKSDDGKDVKKSFYQQVAVRYFLPDSISAIQFFNKLAKSLFLNLKVKKGKYYLAENNKAIGLYKKYLFERKKGYISGNKITLSLYNEAFGESNVVIVSYDRETKDKEKCK